MSFRVALVKFHLFGINWNVFYSHNAEIVTVYYYSENRATSRIWKVIPNMVFPPIWGGNGGVLSMCMQVILDSLFARAGSAPM